MITSYNRGKGKLKIPRKLHKKIKKIIKKQEAKS